VWWNVILLSSNGARNRIGWYPLGGVNRDSKAGWYPLGEVDSCSKAGWFPLGGVDRCSKAGWYPLGGIDRCSKAGWYPLVGVDRCSKAGWYRHGGALGARKLVYIHSPLRFHSRKHKKICISNLGTKQFSKQNTKYRYKSS